MPEPVPRLISLEKAILRQAFRRVPIPQGSQDESEHFGPVEPQDGIQISNPCGYILAKTRH